MQLKCFANAEKGKPMEAIRTPHPDWKDRMFDHHLRAWDLLNHIVEGILIYFPCPIVEIGMGASSLVFAGHAKKHKVPFYSCDIEMGGMFHAFDKPLCDEHKCYIGRSEDFIKEFDDQPGIVFIDGEHEYATVKMEFDFFFAKLKRFGVVFFHDMMPVEERLILKKDPAPHDIYKLRQELERNPDIDVFTWPYSALGMGLTMVMKHSKQKRRPYWCKNGRVV